jgi:hypothetical protein
MPSHSMFSIKAAGQSHIPKCFETLEHHYPSFSHNSCQKLEWLYTIWWESHIQITSVNRELVRGKSMYPKKISMVYPHH